MILISTGGAVQVGPSSLRELEGRNVTNVVPPDRGMGGSAWAGRPLPPSPMPRDQSGTCPGLPRRRSTSTRQRRRTARAPARTWLGLGLGLGFELGLGLGLGLGYGQG